mgnify:FL=1
MKKREVSVLKKKVLESDQGIAFRSVSKSYETIHLKCFRNHLASLKGSQYSYEVETLLKAASTFETFFEKFNQITFEIPNEIKNK